MIADRLPVTKSVIEAHLQKTLKKFLGHALVESEDEIKNVILPELTKVYQRIHPKFSEKYEIDVRKDENDAALLHISIINKLRRPKNDTQDR